jgi:hypothetical protein
VHHLFIDFKKAYDSARRELGSILIEFRMPTKIVGLIEMCLNETYSTVHIGKNLKSFLFKSSERKRCFITMAFNLCFGICSCEG